MDALARLGSRALAAGYADARRFGGAVPGRSCRDMVVPADDRGFAMMACPVGGAAPDKTSRRHLQRHGDDTGNGNAAGADIRWQRHEWRQKEEKYAVAHDRHSRHCRPSRNARSLQRFRRRHQGGNDIRQALMIWLAALSR
ncbi:MAG: hypothetical protein ACJ8FV_00315 [Xanthobacteraceae bacterium]